MSDVPQNIKLPISALLLDSTNPRLPDVQSTQQDAIRAMLKAQGEKIIALAQHLLDHGPNPASLPIVIPSEDADGMYEVLDGNRRLTALKLLESPSLADGILDKARVQRLKRMSARFEKTPIASIECVIFADREKADTWIQLIHRGENEGAGLVEWDGQVAARYDARQGSKPAALQVLDYVKDHGAISDASRRMIDEGKFPITNLERLVNTPYVRNKLGLTKSNSGEIELLFPPDEVLRGLARVVEDISSGQITVSDIKRQQQRIDYINNLPQEDTPKTEAALPSPLPLGGPDTMPTPNTPSQKAGTLRNPSQRRSSVMPKDCKLNINDKRISDIARELKRLSVDDYPNAAAVLMRVFIELSLDHFLQSKTSWDENKLNSTLAQKFQAAINFLESNGSMTSQELVPAKRIVSGQTFLAAAVKTMHSYVHNRYSQPIPGDLKLGWDEIQPFIEALWA